MNKTSRYAVQRTDLSSGSIAYLSMYVFPHWSSGEDGFLWEDVKRYRSRRSAAKDMRVHQRGVSGRVVFRVMEVTDHNDWPQDSA